LKNKTRGHVSCIFKAFKAEQVEMNEGGIVEMNEGKIVEMNKGGSVDRRRNKSYRGHKRV
jgi:hypothetical protein